jgi:hypothetical protein
MDNGKTMHELSVLIDELSKTYESLRQNPSFLEVDLMKEKLRRLYEVAGEIEIEKQEARSEKREERSEKREERTEKREARGEIREEREENGGTVADRFMNGDDRTLAARIQKKIVQDLKSAIGLNDKFVFIKELFQNNVLEYNDAVENLNIAGSREQAQNYLSELRKQYDWEEEAEPYQRFAAYIEKKYA